MSNVLNEEKRQQVIALGRLGWPLRRIQQETGVHRETAGAYLKAAGVAVRPPGAWGRRPPAKPANEVTPDSLPRKPADGANAEQEYAAGAYFDVAGKSGFTIEVKSGLCEYICSFL